MSRKIVRRRRVQEGALVEPPDAIPIRPQVMFKPERLVVPASIGHDLQLFSFSIGPSDEAVRVDPDQESVAIDIPADATSITLDLRPLQRPEEEP